MAQVLFSAVVDLEQLEWGQVVFVADLCEPGAVVTPMVLLDAAVVLFSDQQVVGTVQVEAEPEVVVTPRDLLDAAVVLFSEPQVVGTVQRRLEASAFLVELDHNRGEWTEGLHLLSDRNRGGRTLRTLDQDLQVAPLSFFVLLPGGRELRWVRQLPGGEA